MPRPDPALLDPARYPFSCAITPRFGDLDVNLHVNNVAMAGFLEDGRVRFHHASGYRTSLKDLSTMIASNAIEYLDEVHYPDAVEVHGAIEAVGRSSHTVVQLVTQHGRIAVFARSVLVGVGPQGPIPLPPAFVASAPDWMLRP